MPFNQYSINSHVQCTNMSDDDKVRDFWHQLKEDSRYNLQVANTQGRLKATLLLCAKLGKRVTCVSIQNLGGFDRPSD